ncbi:MAG: SGNH/GDSL hydrolase family protein [Bacteroidales bacterium]|nr:SGNH/GDSL hydrolase family protein [Bacteroidales bacterium]
MKQKALLLTVLVAVMAWSSAAAGRHWVATWATAQQVVEPHNCPPAPGLAGNSLRQIVQTSISGKVVRIKLSNEFGREPVTVNAAEMARAATAGSSSDIMPGTEVGLSFGGHRSVTIQPGELVTSDPVGFPMGERQNVAITLHLGQASSTSVTGHPGSRTDSYLAEGQTSDFGQAVKTAHWYLIDAIEVEAEKRACAVVVLGNSITDGRGSTTNGQNRWTDNLSRRLLANAKTRRVAVLNMGLGGNCVLFGGLGPTGRSRYRRDLFGQEGVKYIILFEGVNDLGGRGDALDKADRIVEVYKQIIAEAHERGIYVYGAPVMQFKGNGYYSDNHEAGRQRLNQWIRTSGLLDGVIDFDAVMGDPDDPARLNADYLFEHDYLHPNAEGYVRMADCIDLKLFQRKGRPVVQN